MYKLILPFRYFLKRRITWLGVAAVALCVFIVVVVMTVMNGLVDEFRGKNHEFTGDCVVSTDSLVGFAYYEDFISELEGSDFVEAVSAVVKGYGLLTMEKYDWTTGIEVMGLDPVEHNRVTNFGQSLYYRRNALDKVFVPSYDENLSGCVVGIDLPYPVLNVTRDRSGFYIHDNYLRRREYTISCFPLNAKGGLARAGVDIVNTKRYYFSDDSHSGLVKIDGRVVYLPFEDAQLLLGMAGGNSRASAIHIKFSESVGLDEGCRKVRARWETFCRKQEGKAFAGLLDNVSVQSWIEYRRGSIAAMEKEQVMMMILFLMLGIITVFIIFVVFYMIISHKSKDIGILKSVGVSNISVVEIFLRFAAFVGLTGAGIGVAGGCIFLIKINDLEDWLFAKFNWQLWDRSVYAIGEIPNRIEAGVLGIIVLCSVCACLAGALLPSVQAARRRPAEILQVDQL
jgi:ABC-type lipoprotein release transport system permease subunit